MTMRTLLPSAFFGAGRTSRRARGLWLAGAFLLSALIGVLDYQTGYELRLGILYLLPIALATWTGGRNAGLSIAAAACLWWLLSFSSSHTYMRPILFYWDGMVMAATFVIFAVLLDRLHLALVRADERFARLIGELRAGAYVVDAESGKVLYANQRLAQMLERDPLGLSGKELGEFFTGGESGAANESGPTEPGSPAFASRESFNAQSGRWYLVQSGAIPWRDGRVVRLKVVTDITDRRHAQSLRRENRDILKRTARLSELAEATTTLAHEINQPLMAIASYSDACLRLFANDNPDREELMRALEKTRAQALRAGQIVSRMRDAVRSKNPQPEVCDPNAIIREALELMETRIEDDCVSTDVSLGENLPPVMADRFLLVQVVVNLLENAVDAMSPLAQTRRHLSVTTALQEDGMIGVSIVDRGIGVSEAVGEHLYTPFHTSKPHGLGLGLSICRSVVEAHGGRLWHRPNPNGGTIFQFTIATEGV